MYKKVEDKPTAYYDVDECLVDWVFGQGDTIPATAVTVEYPIKSIYNINGREVPVEKITNQIVIPNSTTINMLKEDKLKGMAIVVWSQGGADWAESVVKTLKLENVVDLIVSKPEKYIDDLDCKEFMGTRILVNGK